MSIHMYIQGVIFARHKPNLAPKPGEAGPGKTGLTFPHGAEVLWLAAHMFLQVPPP